jgi:hypothetical protein
MAEGREWDKSFDRRRFLQRAAVAGSVAWAAPMVVSSAASAAAGSGAPRACTPRGQIFFDNFSQDQQTFNQYTFVNWWVPDPPGGSVDNIGVIDLDGSTSNAGRFALKDGSGGSDAGSNPGNNAVDVRPSKFSGRVYTLMWDVTHADPQGNSTFVLFGELPAQPWGSFTATGTFLLTFTATSNGPIDLWFKNRFIEGAGDNTGPYITNVRIIESCP